MSGDVRTWHYGLVARWWAEFNQGGDDVEVFRRLIESSGQPVLDAGCGTGRLLLPLLRDGVDIDGSDVDGCKVAGRGVVAVAACPDLAGRESAVALSRLAPLLVSGRVDAALSVVVARKVARSCATPKLDKNTRSRQANGNKQSLNARCTTASFTQSLGLHD